MGLGNLNSPHQHFPTSYEIEICTTYMPHPNIAIMIILSTALINEKVQAFFQIMMYKRIRSCGLWWSFVIQQTGNSSCTSSTFNNGKGDVDKDYK